MSATRIAVNIDQTHRIGHNLMTLDWKSAGYNTLNAALPPSATDEQAIDYFFFTSMLLFDFKNVEATLADGRYIKGTDVFFHLAKRAGETSPNFWSASAIANASDDDLARAFSLTNDPTQPALPRVHERVALLRDAAHVLLRDWDGRVINLLEQRPSLRPDAAHQHGLLDTLVASFKGYSDPLFKKVFVFLKALDVTGRWQPLDPANVLMPVDYHVIRLALRNGTITINDDALAEQLRSHTPVSQADELALREAVMDAYQQMIQHSGLSVYFVDEIFWLIGRSCCHYNRPPRCTTCDYSDCSVQPAFNYQCPGKCPLAATCLGAQDERYSSLLEPNIITIHY